MNDDGETTKPIFIQWCPKDALDGMQMLDAMTELAYRRIIDLIYAHNNKLPDNDVLAWATKTMDQWPEIRARLIAIEKIYIKDGYVRNKPCDRQLAKIRQIIAQKRAAGQASANARNPVKRKDNRTPVGTGVATGGATEAQREANKPITNNQEPRKEDDDDARARRNDAESIRERVCERHGFDESKNPTWAFAHDISIWLRRGATAEDIEHAIALLMARRTTKGIGPPNSWEYFRQAVADAKETREAGLPGGEVRAAADAHGGNVIDWPEVRRRLREGWD